MLTLGDFNVLLELSNQQRWSDETANHGESVLEACKVKHNDPEKFCFSKSTGTQQSCSEPRRASDRSLPIIAARHTGSISFKAKKGGGRIFSERHQGHCGCRHKHRLRQITKGLATTGRDLIARAETAAPVANTHKAHEDIVVLPFTHEQLLWFLPAVNVRLIRVRLYGSGHLGRSRQDPASKPFGDSTGEVEVSWRPLRSGLSNRR